MRIITTKDFGKLIRETRKKSRLTQAQLAGTSNLGERFVRELEQGKLTCQLEKALHTARMLGIKLKAEPPQIDE
jgi:y4mF family transcriptional regulator